MVVGLACAGCIRFVAKMMRSTVLYPKILPASVSSMRYGKRVHRSFLLFSLMMVAKRICVRLLRAKSIFRTSSSNSSLNK